MEPRFMEPLELFALLETTVTVTDVGLEGIALRREDGSTVVIWPCFNCGGEGAHLNFGVNDGSTDSSAA